MKYLAITIILFSSYLLISCRDTRTEDPTKDIVEDFDEIMQDAEDDIKEVIIKDSTNTDSIYEKKLEVDSL